MDDSRVVIHAGLTAILIWLALYFELQAGLFRADINFCYMETLASQRVWAVMFLTAANLGIVGLSTSHSVCKFVSVLVVSTTYGVFAGCLILGGTNVWSGTYTILALMGYFLTFRRARAGL